MKLPMPSFLSPVMASRKVLVVQTGSPELLARAVDRVRENEPDFDYTVLLQREMEGKVPLREGVTYLVNEGPKPSFIARLRAENFGRAWVMFTNEPGYWKLKLLPFLLGASEVRVLNENLDWFVLSVQDLSPVAQHLRWRLESSVTRAALPGSGAIASAARAASYPALLLLLGAWEQGRLLRARLRGGADWKDPP